MSARELVDEHPDLHAALAGGLVDGWRTRLIVEALRPLPDDARREVEQQILAEAPGLTAGKLAERLRRLVIIADPRDAAQRHAQARAARRVTTRRGEDGMGQLFGELPAEDLAIVDQIIDQVADALKDADPNDTRTKVQRRADALVRICHDVACAPDTPAAANPAAATHTRPTTSTSSTSPRTMPSPATTPTSTTTSPTTAGAARRSLIGC